MDERRGHGDALAHALGVFGDQFAAFGLHFEKLQQPACPRDGGGAVQPVHAADEFQKLGARQAVEQQRLVGHQADAPLDVQFVARAGGMPSSLDGAGRWGTRPVSMRMVVDLPAPLGPRKPKKDPRGTSRSTPSTAAFEP